MTPAPGGSARAGRCFPASPAAGSAETPRPGKFPTGARSANAPEARHRPPRRTGGRAPGAPLRARRARRSRGRAGRRPVSPRWNRSTDGGRPLPTAPSFAAATGALLTTLLVPAALSAPAIPTASVPASPTATAPASATASLPSSAAISPSSSAAATAPASATASPPAPASAAATATAPASATATAPASATVSPPANATTSASSATATARATPTASPPSSATATAPSSPTASPPSAAQPEESDAIPVRVTEGTNFAVAASPDGATLVFDLQGTLWRLPAAGGEAEPLTDGLGDDRLPDFHPDGSRVVFQSYRSGTWDLWALTLPPETPDTAPEAAPDPAPPTDFPAPERLTDSAGDDREPAWSPDGTRIAFASDRGGTYDLWLLTVATGELRQLTTALGNESEPAWTPDGAALVYVAVPEGEADGALHHLTLDPPGTPPVPIPGTAGKVSAPAPAPDGRRVAFRRLHYEGLTLMGSRFDLGTASDLALVPLPPPGEPASDPAAADPAENTPAPELRLLDNAGDDLFPFRPQWADADTLLYTADGALRRLAVPETPTDPTEPDPADATTATAPETIPFTAELTVRRPPRRRARLRTEADEPLPVRGVIRPSLSPDGKTLLYAALGDLWTLPLDTGDAPQAPRPLTRDTWEDTDPLWAPDGRSVLFASDRRGSMDLWEKRLDSAPGAGLTQLTSRLGAETAPALSPDGRRLAYLDEAGNLRLTTRDPDRAPTPTTTAAPTPIPDDQILYLGRRGLGMPSWSSDNETIALAALTPFSSRFREGHNRIALVSATTGEARLLDAPAASVGTRDADGPVFSPDGRALAFALDGGLSVLPVDPQGVPEGEPRRLFTGPADFLSWAPDGRSLLALSGARLLRIPTDAAAPTEPATPTEPAANAAPEEIRLRHTFTVPPPAGRLLLTGVRVLAPEGDRLLPDREVLIEAGRIVSVTETPAETAETDAPFDEDLRVLHLPGATLIPGLIEMHTHPMGAAFGNRFGRAHLVYGITSVRITAAAPYRAVAEREAILAGRRVGPRLFLTGATLDGSRIYYPGSAPAGGGVAMDAAFRQTEELDYDLLKTYVRLDDASQREAIRRAHRRGVFVTSHEIYPAVRYGVDGLEHLKGTSRRGFSPKITDLGRSYGDVRALLSRSGVFFTPTLLIYGGWDLALAREPALLERDRRIHALPPWLAARLIEPPEQTGDPESRRALMRPMWDTVAAVEAAGGRIVGGTDTPIVPYGLGLILELEQLAEAGLGTAGALRTATTAAAEALGLSGELGVIAPGAVADLVLLDGDPLEDPRNLRRVRAVLSNGRLATLDQLLSR